MSRFIIGSRASCILLILFSQWNCLTWAYSKPNLLGRRQTITEQQLKLTPSVEKKQLGDETELSEDGGLDRRRFFSTMIGLGSIGMASSNALAADFGMKLSSSTGTNGASKSNTMGGVSKKAGGLANKIRGICIQMVGCRL
jgi:hypothetical protein